VLVNSETVKEKDMKLLYCNNCRDIVKLCRTTRTCHCGATGGHYKQDGLNAIYYGPAIPLGFANASFRDARDNQPEFGMGTNFNAFVIPIVCPTMKLVDLSDYTEVYEEDSDYSIDKMMERAALESNIKKTKIKNVFKDED
jgi:hypothetical protein